VFLLLALLSGYSLGAEQVILRVSINTVDKGDYFFLLTEEGDPLFRSSDLKGLGLKEIPEKAVFSEEGYVSLISLFPEVRFEIDEKESALIITADPRLFERHIVDFIRKGPSNVVYRKDNSAFLNYHVGYGLGDEFDFRSLSIHHELGVKLSDYFGFSSFSYTENETEQQYVRLMSSITRDDPKALRRYVLGDFSATSGGMLGSSGIFGGLSISKNFSMSPYFIKFPGMDLSGVLQTPSEVEVYVNDMLIRKEELEPGEYEFLNLPVTSGTGNTTLVLRDAYGREERIITPFYLSSRLLKPGLHEYSYNLGKRREDFGQKSFEYSDLSFLGFHRIGFSRELTGGLRAEVDKDIINFGPTASFLLKRAGEIDTSLAFSDDNGQYGYGASLGYSVSGRKVNGRLSLSGYSRDYANISLAASEDKPRFRGIVGLGFHQKAFGSISATFSFTGMHTGSDEKRTSLFYSRKIFKNMSLYISANRTENEEVTDDVFVGLNFTLGKSRSGSINYNAQDDISTMSASIQKSPPRGTGYGYRASVETREDEQDNRETSGDASLQYNGPYGIYSGEYRRAGDQDSCDFKLSGSIAFINKSLYLSRPIHDSFALVKVSDVEGVKVKYSNQDVGSTNNKGEVIVPGLISYYDNKLSIEPVDLPLEYNISETTKYVSTPYRSGGIVEFDVSKLQTFEGRLFFVTKGEKTPAEYAGLELKMDDRTIEAIVGLFLPGSF